jgi:hypothetical protein
MLHFKKKGNYMKNIKFILILVSLFLVQNSFAYDLQLWAFTGTIQSVRAYAMGEDEIAVVNVTGGNADRFAVDLKTEFGKLMYASLVKNIGKTAHFWYNADNSTKYAMQVLEHTNDWQATMVWVKRLYQVQFQ